MVLVILMVSQKKMNNKTGEKAFSGDRNDKKSQERDYNVLREKYDKICKDYDRLNNEKRELEQLLKRLAADFDNYKKRVETDKKSFSDYCKKELIQRLLTIVDNFELALNNTKDHEQFVKGVEMIYSQLMTFLENEGVKTINCENQVFDPKLHEPLMIKNGDEDNKILEVIQKGYFLNDILLRPAKVIVSRKEGNSDDKKNQNTK